MIRAGGKFWAGRPALTLAVGWLAVYGWAVTGLGQVDHLPPGTSPGGGLPTGQMTAPAVVDTSVAILEFPGLDQAPDMLHTVQDTVLFGGLFHLALDFTGDPVGLNEIRLAAGEEWLLPEPRKERGLLDRMLGRNAETGPEVGDLPAAGDSFRLIRTFRVYRAEPFRIQAGSFLSPVIQVVGRIAGTDETAGIRTPRPTGWSPWVVLGLVLLLVLLLWLAKVLWERSRGEEALADREIPPPAWISAAIEMRDLVKGGSLSRGDSRVFLDGLAGIARKFVAGRYRVAAQEMTGREIITACARLGHRSTQPGVFAQMIDVVDHHRYNPDGSSVAWCREQAVLLFGHIARVRVMPMYTQVPPAFRSEGDKAWTDLKRELSTRAGRLSDPDAAISGRRT